MKLILLNLCRSGVFVCLLFTLFGGCKKGDLVVVDRYMKFKLDVFFTDTSLYQVVQLGDTVLAENAETIAGSYTTLTNQTGLLKQNRARLSVKIIKKNNPALQFNDTIALSNINDFLLLQLDPSKKPLFINKATEAAKETKPGADSLKIRFFFNEKDNLLNQKNGFTKVTRLNMQLYVIDQDNSGNAIVKKDLLIEGIGINQLSEYAALRGARLYGYDLIDVSDNVANNAKILQKHLYNPDLDVDFVEGKIFLNPASAGIFQTYRINLSDIVDFYGDDHISYNGNFLFGFK